MQSEGSSDVPQAYCIYTDAGGAIKMSGSSGWQISPEAARNYRRFTLPNMIPWIDDLVGSAQCGDGQRILDVACGTGLIANRAAELYPKAKVTGIDLNEGMLALAKENTAVDWHLGNAIALPFEDRSFDVVLCQQGLQYFPDRGKAVREMARVLVPGGRLALNVWGPQQRAVLSGMWLEMG
jgi:ubiquinone/menaquinone biosynthesis C-methylase UbiE